MYPINNPSFFSFLSQPVYWLLGIGILILLFALLREVTCWYWKVNKIVELLKDIKVNTTPENKKVQPTNKQSTDKTAN